jgi:hypothetical protein
VTAPRRIVALAASVVVVLLGTLVLRLAPIPDGLPNRLDVDLTSASSDRARAESEIAALRATFERLRAAAAPATRERFVSAIEADPDAKDFTQRIGVAAHDASPIDRLFVAVLRRNGAGLASSRGPSTVSTWRDAPFLAVGLLSLFSVGMWLRSDRLSEALHENVEIVVNFALLLAVNAVISVTLGTREAAQVGGIFAVFGALVVVAWLVALWCRSDERPLAAYASTAAFVLLALPRVLP